MTNDLKREAFLKNLNQMIQKIESDSFVLGVRYKNGQYKKRNPELSLIADVKAQRKHNRRLFKQKLLQLIEDQTSIEWEKELYDLIFKKHSIYEQSAGIDWFSWKKELYNGHPETVFNDLNKLIIKLHGKRDLEDLATVLKKFADFCHTKYLGCWRDKKEDSWKYSYETEVGNMVKKYIKFLEKKD